MGAFVLHEGSSKTGTCFESQSSGRYCDGHFLVNQGGYTAQECEDVCDSDERCEAYTTYTNWCPDGSELPS